MSDNVSIACVGDIMPGDHYFTLGHGVASIEAKNGFDNMLGNNIKKIFSQSDIVFCNLEGVLSENTNKNISFEKAAFRGNKSLAEGMSRVGINLVNLANNHILQHGSLAFQDTVDSLQAQNINILGLCDSSGEYTCEPVVLDVKGLKLGALGYSAVAERYCEDNDYYATYDEKSIINDVMALKSDVDILIVSVHCGEEGSECPDVSSKNIAKVLIDNNVDVILMHHTHVFQPVLQVGGRLLALNLGDFIFDLFWDRRLFTSAILNINIDQEKDITHRIMPTIFGRDYKVELLDVKCATKMIQGLDYKASHIKLDNSSSSTCDITKNNHWNEKWLQLKKFIFFVYKFNAGNTLLKFKFISSKIRKVLM